MKIAIRIKHSITGVDSWKYKFENKSKRVCDICGSRLFIAPHGGIYCDAVHTEIEAMKNKTEERKPLFTTKHYKAMALVLRKFATENEQRIVIELLSILFKSDNIRFSKVRFRKAVNNLN